MMEHPPEAHVPDVLLVEDDVELRTTLEWLFEEESIPLRLAGNGEDALAAVRSAAPAVILLDLTLPGMPAEEFVRVLQTSPQLAEIPVIVLSAVRDLQTRSRELGVAGALAKPYDVDSLLDLVRAHAGKAPWARI